MSTVKDRPRRASPRSIAGPAPAAVPPSGCARRATSATAPAARSGRCTDSTAILADPSSWVVFTSTCTGTSAPSIRATTAAPAGSSPRPKAWPKVVTPPGRVPGPAFCSDRRARSPAPEGAESDIESTPRVGTQPRSRGRAPDDHARREGIVVAANLKIQHRKDCGARADPLRFQEAGMVRPGVRVGVRLRGSLALADDAMPGVQDRLQEDGRSPPGPRRPGQGRLRARPARLCLGGAGDRSGPAAERPAGASDSLAWAWGGRGRLAQTLDRRTLSRSRQAGTTLAFALAHQRTRRRCAMECCRRGSAR
jgi:hypothetical protein